MGEFFNYKAKKQVQERGNFGLVETKEVDGWNITKIVIHSIITLFLIITIFSSFKTIKSGEVGLKVRFGKIVDSSLKEGFNLKIPYIERIVKVNIKVQKVETSVSGASKDLQDINAVIAVNYHVSSDAASTLYKKVGNEYQDIILNPAIQESIKSVLSQFTAEEAITSRAEVSQKALVVLQNKMKDYGIIVDDFNIINLAFSAEYSRAIEEKQVAEQQVQTAKQQLEKSKIESERKIVEAQAEAKANELKKKTLTKEIIMQEFIEKWNGELPKVSGGNSYFDISSIMGK